MKIVRLFSLCSLLLMVPILREWNFSHKAILAPFVVDVAPPIETHVREALLQPYRYLGGGRQTLVFLSQDHQWVIKFFRRAYMTTPLYLQMFPNQIKKRQMRKGLYKQGYLLAEQELHKETALAYLHLGPSKELPQLTLHDRFGLAHKIDLNRFPFVVQKKTTPFYPLLLSPMARQTLHQFFLLIAKRIKKGIADKDHEIEGNFGIHQGTVIQIDPGRFYLDAELNNKDRVEHEWWSSTHRLRKWLVEKRPELVPFFDEEEAHFILGIDIAREGHSR